MKYMWVLVLFVIASFSVPAQAQSSIPKGSKEWVALEKVLDDVNQQWLCVGKYNRAKRQDCVNFRAKYWVDEFFEIGQSGKIQTKAQMVASQSAAAPAADIANPKGIPGVGPNPQEFKLAAVYGNIALGTDHTIFKSIDAQGQLHVTSETHVIRVFVKENGTWRPLSAALGPIVK